MISKIYSFFLAFLLAFIFSCTSKSENVSVKTFDRNAIIDSVLNDFQKRELTYKIDSVFLKNKFNGTVSLVKSGEKIYERTQGFEDFVTKKQLDSNSVFAIGSVSKQFTAVMILLLQEKGKLSVEDKVSKYLPQFQNRTFENITIQQLLSHTSGISDSGNGLQSKPGTKFSYSNKGYRFLGEIIEKASGKPFHENAAELFSSLKMTHSSSAKGFAGENLAGAYLGTPLKFERIQNMPQRLTNPSISEAAGGILSTVTDLHRWNFALYNGKVLNADSFAKFIHPEKDFEHYILGNLRYGCAIMMTRDLPFSYLHSGYVKGSPSLNVYYPSTKISLVILSNIADESKGKNSIFAPHKAVKKAVDAMDNLVRELRGKMIKN